MNTYPSSTNFHASCYFVQQDCDELYSLGERRNQVPPSSVYQFWYYYTAVLHMMIYFVLCSSFVFLPATTDYYCGLYLSNIIAAKGPKNGNLFNWRLRPCRCSRRWILCDQDWTCWRGLSKVLFSISTSSHRVLLVSPLCASHLS